MTILSISTRSRRSYTAETRPALTQTDQIETRPRFAPWRDRLGVTRPPRLRYVRHDLSSMGRQDSTRILEEVEGIVAEAAGSSYGRAQWAVEHLRSRIDRFVANAHVMMIMDGETAVGMLIYEYGDIRGRPALNLLAAYIRPEYQGCGLGFSANARLAVRYLLRHPIRGFYMTGELSNPLILSAWRRHVPTPKYLYPPLGSESASPSLIAVANEHWRSECPSIPFDSAVGVLRGRVAPRGECDPPCGDPVVDDYFSRNVDAQSGDGVLMVLDVTHRGLIAYGVEILRALPRMFAGSSFLGLTRTAVPSASKGRHGDGCERPAG